MKMAKIIKKRTVRRINWSAVAQLTLILAIGFWFTSAVFVRSDNAKVARQIESTNIAIDAVKRTNETLLREANALGDYANIVEKAEQAGLQHFTENSVFVNLGD